MEKLTLSEVMQCLKDEFSTDKWSRQSVKDILERLVWCYELAPLGMPPNVVLVDVLYYIWGHHGDDDIKHG